MTNLVVTEQFTYRGNRAYLTPPDGLAGGLPAFLDRVVRSVAGVGVVLVDERAAARLGLPTDELPNGGAGRRHPAAAEARAAGWEVDEVHRWSRFRRAGQEVNLGLLRLIDPDYCPLFGGGPLDSAGAAGALDAWQQLSGQPYWGDAGDAVNRVIMATANPRLGGKPIVPAWRPQHCGPPGVYARTFHRNGFDRSADHKGRYLLGYDATRAYLSALSVVSVCPIALRQRGPIEFDPKLSGFWLVQLEPWTIPKLPAPWGHYSDDTDRKSLVWLTTPDLVLLSKLHDQKRYGGFTIHDSYVGHADRAVMRPAADRLRAMWDGAKELHVLSDREAIHDTIRAGYHAMHGKWRSLKRNADILRPDWAAALVATARCNLWRRIDQAAAAKRYPAYVDGIDTVYYATDDPAEPPPAGIVTARFPLNVDTPDTDRLGTFRLKYTIDREQGADSATSQPSEEPAGQGAGTPPAQERGEAVPVVPGDHAAGRTAQAPVGVPASGERVT